MSGSSDGAIRVLLVDDHTIFRTGLASVLASQDGFEVVGQAASGREAVERAQELMPDIIVMDVLMPYGDGLEATRRIKGALPYARIVMLTASEEEQVVFEAMKSGAQGYLLKTVEAATLFATLRAVMRGEVVVSHAMAGKILGEFSRLATGPGATQTADLTAREREVLGLLTQGTTNKEIAAALGITESTVKNHLRNILEKLHLENRVQAATFALRIGLGRQGR
jgi:DNA-binding NarL/FixJ family response regulator